MHVSDEAGRPPENRRASQPDSDIVALQKRADLALRIAWLRVTGQQMFEVDPGGQLSANLFDLADLLEALDRDGRVIWR